MRDRSLHAPSVLLLLGLVALPPALAGQAHDPEGAALTITGEDVLDRIGVLAHDSMRGRDTPSPELEETARWIGREFDRMGLEPGVDGDWLQRYPIRVASVDLDASGVTSSTGATAAFGADVLPSRFSPPSDFRLEGPVLLLVGAPGPGDLAAADVEGRHVVYVGPSEGVIPTLRAALGAGATSVLLASDADAETWSASRTRAEGRRTPIVGEGVGGASFLEIRDEALGELLGLDPRELRERAGSDFRLRRLPSITLTVDQQARLHSEESAPNVVGVLPGSDPVLRDEYVVFSAHMDHVGVGSPDETGDSIFNGADDDASGTAVVMEVAEAMASLRDRPRRSMIFLLVSGEEKGLWGSAYFAENPIVPVEAIVANLNADMVGRNWPDTIVAIGRKHSDLGQTLERVNEARPDLGMTAIDDIWPEENFYRRSDHFNFARRGVPVLFFFNGTHDDYHRPSDEVELIDEEKAARIGRLLFWLGLEVGNADEKPRWEPESYRSIVEEAGRG